MPSKIIQIYSDNEPAFPKTVTTGIVNEDGESLDTVLGRKQDGLTSGVNIKTINGNNVLGSGNIPIDTSSAVWGNISGDMTLQTDLVRVITELNNSIQTLNNSVVELTRKVKKAQQTAEAAL